MTASPQAVAAFEAWKNAELAAYYFAPCPDEVMDKLTALESDAFDVLQLVPAATAEDMLLKLFPVILREFEPRRSEPPLQPSHSHAYNYDEAFYARLLDDLAWLSEPIKAAINIPARQEKAAA